MGPDDEQDGEQTPRVAVDGGLSRLDRIFGSLAHRRRRAVLYCLRDREQADVETLAREIAAWEQNVDVEGVSAETCERVQADLRHVHLPKLEDYRLVEYDPRTGTASYSHPPELLDDVIELCTKVEPPP